MWTCVAEDVLCARVLGIHLTFSTTKNIRPSLFCNRGFVAGTYGGLGDDVDVPRLPPACVPPGEGGWPPGRLRTGPVCDRAMQGLVGNWGSRRPAGRWPPWQISSKIFDNKFLQNLWNNFPSKYLKQFSSKIFETFFPKIFWNYFPPKSLKQISSKIFETIFLQNIGNYFPPNSLKQISSKILETTLGSQPMRGRDLIMLSEGQWEASKKLHEIGHTERQTDT